MSAETTDAPDPELLQLLDLLESTEIMELLDEWDPEDALPIPLEEAAEEPQS